jgi:CheY-like chemotaxis protein
LASGGNRQQPRVLVCDDEPSMRELLKIVLSRDYEVGEAADGFEALELVRKLEPDVVVLDVMMPGQTGLQVLDEVRRDPALAHTHVIMITAWDHVEPAARAAGADRFLLKPFDAEELRKAVEELLNGS